MYVQDIREGVFFYVTEWDYLMGVVIVKLSDKQEMFCREYLVDLNGTQAALRAGYAKSGASVQASRLLANDKIRARVQELKDERAKELDLDAFWVLKRLKDISDRSMQAEPVKEYDPDTGSFIETGTYEFDSTGANRATELIGKHIGMFDPKLPVQLERLKADIEKVKAETERIKKDSDPGTAQEDRMKEYFEALGEAFRGK